ncbi:MAG: YidC/Oxa1 family membrane protein insertase [Lachnospira sp.]|nr:YidC/Oxa1 family membrane protein insertase [Lachnospira sp.]MDD5829018.1 YidC/Oxa1 family membrane protein insertase [Lachnospira sp.]
MYNAIINPIASFLGKILDILFMGLNAIGIGNVAVAIIIFTLIVKLLMLPLTMKQQKLTKITSIMNPELKKIQDKYKDKKGDQNAMIKMQEETKAVYEKYGVSQMGGCVQLLIQFPILMALYRVFQQIPLYISQIKDLFTAILNGQNGGIMAVNGYADTMKQFGENVDWNNVNAAVNAMNGFSADQWNQLKEAFPAFSQLISENYDKITHMNTFLGVNMSQNPGLGFNIAILIPILAGVSQFISVKIAQGKQQVDDDNPAAASMKMMTLFMPFMSAFIAISVPAGLGVYWIATAVIQTIMQLIINAYYDKLGAENIVKKNVEKRNKKRAKKGLPPETIAKNASVSTKNISSAERDKQIAESLKSKKEANEKRIKEIKESTQYYKTAKAGSLAEKAGMVAKYNEKNEKKKN